jgi:hypothetical protein
MTQQRVCDAEHTVSACLAVSNTLLIEDRITESNKHGPFHLRKTTVVYALVGANLIIRDATERGSSAT